jgi:methylenetetrahydrofolate--tRNA-(uracil-5-)-methyltransferase
MISNKIDNQIVIIGGGLAGCEAAYQLAKENIKVILYEQKPENFSKAHTNKNLAEIVCSNSLKCNLITNACGLLKEELRHLDSLLIKVADKVKVPSGQALAVDREEFSKEVTKVIEENLNIEIRRVEVGKDVHLKDLLKDHIVVIATGPLTSDNLYNEIEEVIGNNDLHFYDAQAPIIEKESINFDIAFYGNRYDEERPKEQDIEEWKEQYRKLEQENKVDTSYINLPMNKEEYENFVNELINAEVVELHEFEKKEIFEGCMPIEIMAKRGIDTLRYGPLKPMGFTDKNTGVRPYAVVQLRQDDKIASLYNMVGFQTNLKFGEQKRVFGMIPGLEDANIIKYGVMHRNTFINAPVLLDKSFRLKIKHDNNNDLYFAGQITGVEGYVESMASGMTVAKDIILKLRDENNKIDFPDTTMIGSLAEYISNENIKDFQPMNANFGILKTLDTKIRDKKQRYEKMAIKSLEDLDDYCKTFKI